MLQHQQPHRPLLRPAMEAYVPVTGAAYSAKAGDRVIGINRAGAVTVTLPTAEARPGCACTIKDESGAAATNNITIATEGSETIDGSATDTIRFNYGAKTYYSDGANWFNVPLLAGADVSARATHSANQSIANNTLTNLALDSEDFDTDSMHDTATNNERLTFKTAGKYVVMGTNRWAAASAGRRVLQIFGSAANDVIADDERAPSMATETTQHVSTILDAAVNDYVYLRVLHTSGNALNSVAASGNPSLQAIKISG